jgi:hypothetical protein
MQMSYPSLVIGSILNIAVHIDNEVALISHTKK